MIRWGIIGAGRIAVRFVKALNHEKDSVLYAVSCRTQQKADAFAKEAIGVEPMKTSLIKLYADSLSNPYTHPLLEFCYYGHPTLLHRLEALSK